LEKYIVNPIVVRTRESERGSIYQSIVAMGFRARQINDDIKRELNERMIDIIPASDDTDDLNYDQIAISKEFDKLPKPTFLAMREIYENKLRYGMSEEELLAGLTLQNKV